MEFLPLRIEGRRVYAGFWKRFCAGAADGIIFIPITFLFSYIGSLDKILAIAITIPSSLLFALYTVYFHARFGGTLGKLGVAIRVTKPDGSRIGWIEAWKRSSVDLVFALVSIVLSIWALIQVDFVKYSSADFMGKNEIIGSHHPSWGILLGLLMGLWFWGEAFVCLCNRRRRAIHDLIGGTVVVHKRVLDQLAAGYDTEQDSTEASEDDQKYLAGMWD